MSLFFFLFFYLLLLIPSTIPFFYSFLLFLLLFPLIQQQQLQLLLPPPLLLILLHSNRENVARACPWWSESRPCQIVGVGVIHTRCWTECSRQDVPTNEGQHDEQLATSLSALDRRHGAVAEPRSSVW